VLDREVVSDALDSQGLINDVLGVLNLSRERVQIVLGIEVKVNSVITEGLEVCPAPELSVQSE
jgi:hypothetical protein